MHSEDDQDDWTHRPDSQSPGSPVLPVETSEDVMTLDGQPGVVVP